MFYWILNILYSALIRYYFIPNGADQLERWRYIRRSIQTWSNGELKGIHVQFKFKRRRLLLSFTWVAHARKEESTHKIWLNNSKRSITFSITGEKNMEWITISFGYAFTHSVEKRKGERSTHILHAYQHLTTIWHHSIF